MISSYFSCIFIIKYIVVSSLRSKTNNEPMYYASWFCMTITNKPLHCQFATFFLNYLRTIFLFLALKIVNWWCFGMLIPVYVNWGCTEKKSLSCSSHNILYMWKRKWMSLLTWVVCGKCSSVVLNSFVIFGNPNNLR